MNVTATYSSGRKVCFSALRDGMHLTLGVGIVFHIRFLEFSSPIKILLE